MTQIAFRLVTKRTSANCRVYGVDDKAALSHESFQLQASAKAAQVADALEQQQQGIVVAKPGSQLATSQGTGDENSMSCCVTLSPCKSRDHAIVDPGSFISVLWRMPTLTIWDLVMNSSSDVLCLVQCCLWQNGSGTTHSLLCSLLLKLSAVSCRVVGVHGGFEEGRSGVGGGAWGVGRVSMDSKAAYVRKPLALVNQ